MVGNTVINPLGLVLIFAANMVFNVPCPNKGNKGTKVNGVPGANINLRFTFNVNITKDSNFGVYKAKTKIAEYRKSEGQANFKVAPEDSSVFYYLTNLTLNDSGCYLASLFSMKHPKPPTESDWVQLTIREENRSSTVPPMPTDIPITVMVEKDSGSPSLLATVLVVLPVVLLVAVLPWLIWSLLRSNGKQQQQQQPRQSSNATLQETVGASNNVPAPPLIYSVLDFPKRPNAVLEINPNGTEYAAVSYLPEQRRV